MGYVVPTITAWRPHPPVWPPPSHFPATPVIGAVFGISAWPPDLPGFHCCALQDCRLQFPPGDSVCAYPSSSILTVAIVEKWEPLGISNNPANSASRGDSNFDDLSVRSRYGPPDCLLSGLIRTREIIFSSCPPGTFTSGLPATGSPQWLPGMTTVPDWELHQRDSHPLA